MKLETKKLQAVVTAVVGALPKKCIIPILTGIRLEIRNFKLIAQATDQDISATAEIETDGVDGSMPPIIVSGKELQKALASAKNSRTIDLSPNEDGTVTLHFNGTVLTIPAFKADEYPMLPEVPDGLPLLTINSEQFRLVMREILYCVTKEASRYTLQAVLMTTTPLDTVAFVATDGHRLGYSEQERLICDKLNLLIPSDLLHLVLKGLPRRDVCSVEIRTSTRESTVDLGDVSVQSIAPTMIFISWSSGDCTINAVAKQCAGKFPNYEQVLLAPEEVKHSAIVDVKELLEAMTLALGTTKDTPHVKFEFSEGILDLSNSHFKKQLTANVKEPVSAQFNPKYIRDFLMSVDTDRCSIVWKDHDSQFELRPVYGCDLGRTYRYAIMPMSK